MQTRNTVAFVLPSPPRPDCGSCFCRIPRKPVRNHMGSLIVPPVEWRRSIGPLSYLSNHRRPTDFVCKDKKRKCTRFPRLMLSRVSRVWEREKTAIYNTYVIYESYIYHVDINYSTITSLGVTPAIHSCQWTKQFPPAPPPTLKQMTSICPRDFQ